MSMRLCREGLISGPSSGEALHGLLKYIGKLKENGKLVDMINPEAGELSCVFTCSDLPYQYLDDYFNKLDESEFPPIRNEVKHTHFRGQLNSAANTHFFHRQILLSCDQDGHDPRWVLQPEQAIQSSSDDTVPCVGFLASDKEAAPSQLQVCQGHRRLKSSSFWSRLRSISCLPKKSQAYKSAPSCAPAVGDRQGFLVLDLRNSNDYEHEHIRGSQSLPIPGYTTHIGSGDLFGDPEAIHWASSSLRTLLGCDQVREILEKAQSQHRGVLVLCYHGDVSRLATAALRKNGVTAFSVKFGFQGLRRGMISSSESCKEQVKVHLDQQSF
jgi:rhodanese-related sulfurtransferase